MRTIAAAFILGMAVAMAGVLVAFGEGNELSKEAREAIEARLALMRYRIEHGWPRKPIAQIVEEGKP